jgi:gliding motility-associated-like protein
VYERTWAGCEGFDTLVVQVAPYPEAYFTWSLPGAGTTIEFLDSSYQAPIVSKYDPSAPPINLSYTMAWNFDKVPGTPKTHIDTIVEFEDRFRPIWVREYTYGYKNPILTVTNEYGCSSSYSTEIFVDIRAGVYIPNAFSPTNAAAGVRTFKPLAFNLESIKFSVFDKWGNLLYYSEDIQDGTFTGAWDGTYNGELLQSDVYIWKMEAKFLDGTTWAGQKTALGGYTKFGNVTLIR